MSACSTCLTTLGDCHYTKHFALNLISKLNNTKESDLKNYSPSFMKDYTLTADKLSPHTHSEDELFSAFSKRVVLLPKKSKSVLINWLSRQWYGDTHQKFLKMIEK